jgi:hypothetical protein
MTALVMAFSALSLGSCKDDTTSEAEAGLSIKVYSPTRVIPGQRVEISGTGLDAVTSVTFPGGVNVTDLVKTGSGLISVVTPTGISEAGGVLVVNTAAESVEAAIPMTVGLPKIMAINPAEEIKTFQELLITGADMEFFEKAIIPGKEEGTEVVVNAIDFVRKANSLLKIQLPAGHAEGAQVIRLVACDGKVYNLPAIVMVESLPGPSVMGPFEGDWTWASGVTTWGNGAYLVNPAPNWWWQLQAGTDLDGQGANPGEGMPESSMTFTSRELILNRSNGTTAKGTYKFNTDKVVANWSIGTLETDGTTVLVGTGPNGNTEEVFAYDVLSITDNRMVLSYAPAGTGSWGTGHFWIFDRPSITVSSFPADLTLIRKQGIVIEGIDDIADWWIDPDFLKPVEGTTNKFNFMAEPGTYRFTADAGRKFFKVEVLMNGALATTQPDGSGAVWVIGDGTIGKPTAASGGINWTPGNGLCMAPIGGNRYRITLVAGQQIGTTAINFKFFHQKNWGGEFVNTNITNNAMDLIELGNGSNGADPGNLKLAAGVTLENGRAYEFILDVSGGPSKAVLTVTAK